MVYARRSGERTLTFDFAEGLLRDNLLIVDRETGSVWSQLHGRAVIGPLEGEPLVPVPALQTTWAHWRERHPKTRVFVLDGEEGRKYLYRSRRPGEARPATRPRAHDVSVLGLGVVVNGAAAFHPFRELERLESRTLARTLGGEALTVHFRPEHRTAWAEDAQGKLLPAVLAYEWGWKEFFPESEIWRAEPAR